MNSSQTFEIIMALISIISILVGGTGATVGLKASSKTKSLERELGELITNQKNQKEINSEIKNDIRIGFAQLDAKIDNLTKLFIKTHSKEGK